MYESSKMAGEIVITPSRALPLAFPGARRTPTAPATPRPPSAGRHPGVPGDRTRGRMRPARSSRRTRSSRWSRCAGCRWPVSRCAGCRWVGESEAVGKADRLGKLATKCAGSARTTGEPPSWSPVCRRPAAGDPRDPPFKLCVTLPFHTATPLTHPKCFT